MCTSLHLYVHTYGARHTALVDTSKYSYSYIQRLEYVRVDVLIDLGKTNHFLSASFIVFAIQRHQAPQHFVPVLLPSEIEVTVPWLPSSPASSQPLASQDHRTQ